MVTFRWNYKVAEWWDSGHLPGAVLGNFAIVKLTNNTQNKQKSSDCYMKHCEFICLWFKLIGFSTSVKWDKKWDKKWDVDYVTDMKQLHCLSKLLGSNYLFFHSSSNLVLWITLKNCCKSLTTVSNTCEFAPVLKAKFPIINWCTGDWHQHGDHCNCLLFCVATLSCCPTLNDALKIWYSQLNCKTCLNF